MCMMCDDAHMKRCAEMCRMCADCCMRCCNGGDMKMMKMMC